MSYSSSISAKQVGEYLYNGDISSIETYIRNRRWFRRKSETITKVVFRDYAILNDDPVEILTILEIYYENFRSEIYYLPLMFQNERTRALNFKTILKININGKEISLFDAFEDIGFCASLLKLIKQNKQVCSMKGVFSFYPTGAKGLGRFIEHLKEEQIRLISTEQTNTSINYGDSLIMKNFRNIEYGLNPDFEITYFLTKKTDLENVPTLYGYIEYQNQDKLTATAAVLQEYIANRGDCWNYTLLFYELIYRIAMRNVLLKEKDKIQNVIKEFGRSFLDEIHKLGEITGKFHRALTTDLDDSAFKAEFVNDEDIDNWQFYIISNIDAIFCKIEKNLPQYSEDVREKAETILKNRNNFIDTVGNLEVLKKHPQKKIRIHGDYHLGQVLKTEDDFVILDFEGEPIKTMEERRAKLLPQKDIAGMLRSFNYATYASLFELQGIDPEEMENLKKWGLYTEGLIANSFIEGYMSIMESQLPEREIFFKTLKSYTIDKAIYELDYEINNRPDWLRIPVEYLNSVSK
jgi:maltose alpha-D-glucosyltransferase/alpha-amylase